MKEKNVSQTCGMQDVEEKVIKPAPGMLMLVINIILIPVCLMIGPIFGGFMGSAGFGIGTAFSSILFVVLMIMLGGYRVVKPNEALVLTLFGKYYGSIVSPGFYFVNPFAQYNNPARVSAPAAKLTAKSGDGCVSTRKCVSLKSMTWENGTQKVNDVMGNPVIIGAVVIWKVENATKAVFNVEDYTQFLSTQTDSTIRNIARLYPYDIMNEDEESNEKTLRGSSQEIADRMKEELSKKVSFAGLVIEEVRITHLSYAEEIAAAMLQRQQVEAIIAARAKIVEGAVSMVQMAIEKLSEDDIVILDEERKAAMVSNLMVVLCSGKDAQPVINNGSIY